MKLISIKQGLYPGYIRDYNIKTSDRTGKKYLNLNLLIDTFKQEADVQKSYCLDIGYNLSIIELMEEVGGLDKSGNADFEKLYDHEFIRDTCTEYNLPSKVRERIISTVELLDSYYGVGRSMNDDGGCVILIIDDDVSRTKQAYEEVLKKYHTCEEEREFQDILYSDRQEEYYADLYIVSSEIGITIIWYQKERS